ncbi:MAG: CoB--CoM heterodisulfide reductase iron-sulfur subunit B family protein [Polyangia bacterium]
MKVGYYPGCSLSGTAREFGESMAAVARALDIELAEIPEWTCCGSSSGHMTDRLLALALPAHVLLKAHDAGLAQVMAPCAACYNRLATARHEIEASRAAKAQVEKVLQRKIESLPRVLNLLELLAQERDHIAAKVTRRFEETVACYYGCLLVRPARITGFDRTEDPVEMDKLVAAVGGKPINWSCKTECCGASFSLSKTSVVGRLGAKILRDAVARKAQAVVVACPMCHANLDLRRSSINRRLAAKTSIPVLYITQVIGMALGIPAKQLGLARHLVRVTLPGPSAQTPPAPRPAVQ